MSEVSRLRVATYNIHKCRGLDRQISPARIADVLREINVDIVALQEVVCVTTGTREQDQARFLAEALAYDYRLGENRQLPGGAYGNVILSRVPLRAAQNYDLSWRRYERRGCLRADIELPTGDLLHIFNVHLGLSFTERRYQARQLVGAKILHHAELQGSRIILGDFNEWTRGLATRLLSHHLQSMDTGTHLGRTKTYPGILPFLHLDHIYFDASLQLHNLTLHRSNLAVVASDHLPLVAEFSFLKESSHMVSEQRKGQQEGYRLPIVSSGQEERSFLRPRS
jgi:endonuclease/exonuclease/phosphatase family metal-dependent hydrolase